jgi:glycosyltransferase involved in cell wall biosynthesis
VLRRAAGLITVSERYAQRLRNSGPIAAHIHVVPCTVDLQRFRFSGSDRAHIRARWKWSAQDIVGVYLGKFGGIYLDELAFQAFAEFLRWANGMGRLLVITATPEEEVRSGLSRHGVDQKSVRVIRATHGEVPAYLSAADLAFALYKGTPSSAYLSPVKNGEYWANGLPVLMTRGVADDSALIEREPIAGALFDPEGNDLVRALEQLRSTLATPDQRERTMAFARQHRSRERMARTYEELLAELGAL